MRAAKGRRGFICRWVPGIFAIALLACLVSCGSSSSTNPPPPPPPSISVAITSYPAGVNAGLSYQFVASVSHATTTAVTWSLACSSACSGAVIGVISPDGTYSATALRIRLHSLSTMWPRTAEATPTRSLPCVNLSCGIGFRQAVAISSRQKAAASFSCSKTHLSA